MNQSLDDAISSLRHSIHDLDKQKGIIQEQIAAATVREVQSALNGSGDLPAKSSLLTLGTCMFVQELAWIHARLTAA